MAAGHVALLCLGLTLLVTDVASQRRCSIPRWRPEYGDNPFTTYRGKVLLVAILRGYCSYCVGQAAGLDALKNRLATEGLTEIAMLVVNGGEPLSRANVNLLEQASTIPVLQDTPHNNMSRQIFHGNKDDFVVYNRCGQRTAYIPHPYSYLGHNVTERVLRALYIGRHSCHCRLDRAGSDPHEVMYSDQHGGALTNAVTVNEIDLDCPVGDSWCRRYERNFRNGRLDTPSPHRGDRQRSRQQLEAELGQGQRGGRNRGGHNRGGHNTDNQQNRGGYQTNNQRSGHRNRGPV